MAETPAPDESERELLGSSSKKLTKIKTAVKEEKTPSISLPHLVYTVEFLETDTQEQAVWFGSNDDDIIGDIIQQSKDDDEDLDKEVERKVIVVLELPSGGAVSRFSVGETDNKLEVEVKTH